MGYGFEVKCKKCKFKQMYLLGVGMMFPEVYRRIVESVRNGEYGEVIRAEQRLYQCSYCNNIEQDYDLSLYLNKNETASEYGYWSYDGDFNHEYKFVKSYVHKCSKCSKRMHVVKNYENTTLPCPKCGSNLKMDYGIRWV
ncbi:MAG: hypothetical protein ACOYBH_07475 [Candidatus Alectryocaccobium sp.]|jgi:DNA-directed RNA polymerase subunit RPC12/RpoP